MTCCIFLSTLMNCVMTFSFLKCCLAEHCVADVIVPVNHNASRTVFWGN